MIYPVDSAIHLLNNWGQNRSDKYFSFEWTLFRIYPQTRNSNRSTGTDTFLAGDISRWHLRISCARFLNEFFFFRRWNSRESRDHQQTFSSGTTGFLKTFVSNLWFRTWSKRQCHAIFCPFKKLKRVSLSTEFFKVMVQFFYLFRRWNCLQSPVLCIARKDIDWNLKKLNQLAAPACKESRVRRVAINSRGPGISPSYLENRRKIEPKEIPSCLISRLLVKFTR